MDRTNLFLDVFSKAEKCYGKSKKRLAAEGWDQPWKVLITTIMSAQSRDETTIKVAELLFEKYDSLEKLSKAKISDVEKILSSVNYYKTKSRHVVLAAKYLLSEHTGRVPDSLDELVMIPGVGRKTANLVLSEVYSKDAICVDTHVHRLSNVFGIVNTKTPEQTEKELMKVVPKEYWSRINRVFVLWGQDVKGYDKEKFLEKLQQ